MTFGENLIALREMKGLSRKDLAEIMDIPYTTLRNYETDCREPGHKFLIQLADILSVSVDELVGREKQKSAPSVSDEALEIAKQYDSSAPVIKKVLRAVLSVDVQTPAQSKDSAKAVLL